MLDDGWGTPQAPTLEKLEHTTTYYNFITLKRLETMLYNMSFAQTTGISKHGGGRFLRSTCLGRSVIPRRRVPAKTYFLSWFWNWFWNWFGGWA
jgi:hypothetical protein